jgi:hypothetical protein
MKMSGMTFRVKLLKFEGVDGPDGPDSSANIIEDILPA